MGHVVDVPLTQVCCLDAVHSGLPSKRPHSRMARDSTRAEADPPCRTWRKRSRKVRRPRRTLCSGTNTLKCVSVITRCARDVERVGPFGREEPQTTSHGLRARARARGLYEWGEHFIANQYDDVGLSVVQRASNALRMVLQV